jgi:uncharacterized protein
VNDSLQEITAPELSVRIVSDGAAGNDRQAMALAAAMRLTPIVQHVDLRGPWRWLAPRVVAGAQRSLAPELRHTLCAPWPDIAIGCGRQAALITRVLRAQSSGATFAVQILDPRIDPANFDVVIAPRHDGIGGANVITTLGALNPVDDAWLANAAEQFSSLLQLPQPRTAVLVGGPRRDLSLNDAWLNALIAHLEALLTRDGGSLLITFSRRTPEHWRARLRGAFHTGCAYFWAGSDDGANPYAGYLAHAERIVVTPDSVNMLSEACATGLPVLSYLPRNVRGKLAAFYAALREESRLHDLSEAAISTLPHVAPLRETAAVADEVWRRYRTRKISHSDESLR